MRKLVILTTLMAVFLLQSLCFASPRTVTSMHEAFIGHWRGGGLNFYITETSVAMRDNTDTSVDMDYSAIEEIPNKRVMLFQTSFKLTLGGYRGTPIPGKGRVKFSTDYQSATLTNTIYGDEGPASVVYKMKYVGE